MAVVIVDNAEPHVKSDMIPILDDIILLVNASKMQCSRGLYACSMLHSLLSFNVMPFCRLQGKFT
jgi:hypothetical protein